MEKVLYPRRVYNGVSNKANLVVLVELSVYQMKISSQFLPLSKLF